MKVSKLLLMVIAMVAFTCSSEQDSTEKQIAEIGSRISRETAESLISNASARQAQKIYIYGKTMLKEILNVDGAEGILIFNSLDDAGETRLVFRPADSNGKVVLNSYSYDDGRVCPSDCSQAGVAGVGKVKAEGQVVKWINAFQAANTSSARSFLFGEIVFNQILEQKGVEGIAFIHGTKSSGQDALVLVGVNENGEAMWDSYIYDDGRVCPSDCN